MIESELEYLCRRTNEEFDIAERSQVAIAAGVHRRLAMLYANRAAEMLTTPQIEVVERMAMPLL